MKNLLRDILTICAIFLLLAGCSETNYPGGEISPYIGLYDVRILYKGNPVELNLESLKGSRQLAATVISDHREGNLPSGMLVVQDVRRLGLLRGITIPLGEQAANYLPGDSLIINIDGTVLDRVDGTLQIRNVTAERITKAGSSAQTLMTLVNAAKIAANPGDYESTLVALVKGGFDYTPSPGQVMSGDHEINDGFGVITVKTDPQSTLANLPQLKMANYYGIIFNEMRGDSVVAYQRMRSRSDLVELKADYRTPKAIITGWSNDPNGTDANNEYMQFMATEDIDFSLTPFSVVTTNNANASTPTGFPQQGWATGGMRTYKFTLSSGFAAKGTFFYVGGSNKLIMSTNSTSIAHANWITAYPYNTQDGMGFGTKTTNLLANSGNAYGIAIFASAEITVNSIPEDAMFVATGGSLTGNGFGYRIPNNDLYDIINPVTLAEQPFYRSGSNTNAMTYNTPSDAGYWNFMGGVFNLRLGRWTTARTKYAPLLTKQSTLEEIENPEFTTKLIE